MKKLGLLLLIFLAAACSGPAAVEPSAADADIAEGEVPAVEAGETMVVENFALTLPDGWLASEATADGLAQMRSESSGLVSLTDSFAQALIASGLQLYAVNGEATAQASVVPPTIMVVRQSAPTSLTLAELVADTTNQLEDIADLSSEIEQRSVMLGDTEAIQISYLMQISPAENSKAVVHNTQYYLVSGEDLYIITVEMGQELLETYLDSSRAAAESFRVTATE